MPLSIVSESLEESLEKRMFENAGIELVFCRVYYVFHVSLRAKQEWKNSYVEVSWVWLDLTDLTFNIELFFVRMFYWKYKYLTKSCLRNFGGKKI